MSKEYVKTIDDEIDWKIIDQLHIVTVNFSSTSLELKKLFFVLIGIAIPVLIKLAGDKLDASLFITLYIFSCTFWFLDSFTFFYQEKLREKMNMHFSLIKARNKENVNVSDKYQQDFTIEITRIRKNRIWRSIFNTSILLYILSILINTLGVILYSIDII